ncbi:hypothetical protein BD410DRAFT_535231 [Rickenella mellea]|uniref:Iminophenyl-pyruvate dimer synthase domain-containing protein n=1 Tax=Rickenella mellea TaxID=50990 RepID=A0A4Y7PSN3_9AGAM|nr:hypothetical protein BD410DRAFT_535231 [Rickenella mellea]
MATSDIHQKHIDTKHHGRIRFPKPEQGNLPITTLKSLQEHLQTAIAVELSTIPLYLYGMYSVNQPGSPVPSNIRGVVLEEMLHLSLAGNTLLAVGGTPKLYDSSIIPKYPAPMLGRVPELILELRGLTKENLQLFIDVETPEAKDAPPESDNYQSLGQFYKAIELGLAYLNYVTPTLFNPATVAFQFNPNPPDPNTVFDPEHSDSGGLVAVKDLASALTAMKTIVDQGEGNPGPYDDPLKLEKDHYDIFKDLRDGTDTWQTFPIISNPTTAGYLAIDKNIHQVSITFDMAYCYLLMTIEKFWTVSSTDGRNALSGNLFGIMGGVLSPLANFLIQQPIGTSGEVAGPCFNYFGFQSASSALNELKAAIQAAVTAYAGNTQLTGIQDTIGGLTDISTI